MCVWGGASSAGNNIQRAKFAFSIQEHFWLIQHILAHFGTFLYCIFDLPGCIFLTFEEGNAA